MQDSEIYKNVVRLKEMIQLILTKEPSLLSKYIDIKTGVEDALSESFELTAEAIRSFTIRRCMTDNLQYRDYRKQSVEVVNKQLIDCFIRYADDLPSKDPLSYENYTEGWLASMTLDLAILKRVSHSNKLMPNYRQQLQELSEKRFEKQMSELGDRINYVCHFPSVDKSTAYKVFEISYYNSKWSLPIRRSWAKTVFDKDLAINDIAGKSVVVISASRLPASEQIALKDESIILYKAAVAYAKTARKGGIQDDYLRAHSLGGSSGDHNITSISYADFQTLNPDFQVLNPGLFIRESTGKVRGETHPVLYVANAKKAQHMNTITTCKFKNYTPEKKGYIQNRYIATYQNSTMPKPKTASGTTPARAIAVLRGRIIKDVLHEMGVK